MKATALGVNTPVANYYLFRLIAARQQQDWGKERKARKRRAFLKKFLFWIK